MSTTAKNPETTPLPGQLAEPECSAFIFPPLSMPTRGPKCKLGSPRLLNRLFWVLSTGMQWKCLPILKGPTGTPEMHDTNVSRACAPWADDGAREQAFIASVAHLADEKKLDGRVLPGDGTNTVAKKGAMGVATRATNPRQGRRSAPSPTTTARCRLPSR